MTHVAFLVGSYYPNFSAVGYCAYQVQKCLVNDFDLSVVALRNSASLRKQEKHGGISIHRVETKGLKRRNSLQARSGRSAVLALWALRAASTIRRLVAPDTVDRSLVRAYVNCLENMNPKPEAIVVLVFPFETVMAALEFKKSNPRVKVIPYLFDDFVNSRSLHVSSLVCRIKRRRNLSLQHRMLEKSNTVLSMHPLRDNFESNFEVRLLEKIIFVEHPLLVKPESDGFNLNRTEILRLCFTGSLIRGVVEPDYLLKLLHKINPAKPVRADFYVMGNDAGKIRTECTVNSINIVNHGRVSKKEANFAISEADILLNIGERRGKQISSKIFEYIATGKPIIHVAMSSSDVVSGILAKYPLSLCIFVRSGDVAEHVAKVEQFINEDGFKRLSFSQVEEIYPEALPETTASLLRQVVRFGV